MKYLIDTCVLSEYAKPRPDPKVVRWMDELAGDQLWVSEVTLAEIQKGILVLQTKNEARADKLRVWLDTLTRRVSGKVLPVNAAVWQMWAQVAADAINRGHQPEDLDNLLIATAHCHNLTIATRNTKHFPHFPHYAKLMNPWELAS